MGVFKTISKRFILAAELSGQRQAQRQLLRMSVDQLDDIGISRAKLLDGLSAWPWTAEAGYGNNRKPAELKFKPAPAVTIVTENISDVAQEKQRVA